MGAAMIARIRRKFLLKTGFALCLMASLLTSPADAQTAPKKEGGSLLIERPIRTWEFLCAVGKRAGVFGNESGRVEAWVYPLKLFREFHVTIHHDGKALPAESLVRTIEARPESTTLVYAGDTFKI